MRIAHVEASLRQHLISAGLRPERDDAAAVLEAMMDWYATERAIDAAPIDQDGDMLLFQWGTHDRGTASTFEYGLTRQLIRADEQSDDGILQLALVWRYPATAETVTLGSGHRWCGSPADLSGFRRELETHPAPSLLRSEAPQEVVLTCEIAG